MSKDKFPITPAIRVLRAQKVDFTPHLYEYEAHGGTEVASRELGVDEHATVKTIILEDEHKKPLIVLMTGDKSVSTKNLARFLNVKSITPCSPAVAQKHTGYLVGGTSPFATRHAMPVYMERSILDLERIYINGGKRGFLVGIKPQDVVKVLHPELVEVATD
jgi:Cys-tRNA(Pro) deacylase